MGILNPNKIDDGRNGNIGPQKCKNVLSNRSEKFHAMDLVIVTEYFFENAAKHMSLLSQYGTLSGASLP